MTVVIAMRAGPGIGVACSDREVTYTYEKGHERKLRYKGRKIVQMDGNCFVGFAGDLGAAERIIYQTRHQLGPDAVYQDILRALIKNYDAIRQDEVRRHVEHTLLISWSDFVSGGLSSRMTESAREMLEDEREKNEVFNVDLLVCGVEEGGIGEKRDFGIAAYRAPGILEYSRYSESVGISDMADISTTEFLEALNPRQAKIGLARCARAVMKAKVLAEKRNPGIGRRGQLVWVDERMHYQETSERQTALLSTVLRFQIDAPGLIGDEAAEGVFMDIVERPQSKEERDAVTNSVYARVRDMIPAEELYRYVLLGDTTAYS